MAHTSTGLVLKKKKWVKIIAPGIFKESIIGETRVAEYEDAIGRIVTVSSMVLTGDPQRQNISLSFEIRKLDGDVLKAEIIGYKITPSALKKMVRRSKDKIEDSFEAKTLDGIKIRVKPILITRNKTKGSINKALRKNMKSLFLKKISKVNYETLIQEMITRRFQKFIIDTLRKISPVSFCEIKFISIIKEKKPEAKIEGKPKEEEKQEAKPEA